MLANLDSTTQRLSSATRRARHRVHLARGATTQGAWRVQTRALDAAHRWLEKASEVPVIGLVARPTDKLVHKGLEAVTAPPWDDYEALNAKTIIHRVSELSRVQLLRLQRHEGGAKNRKTVLSAVERELQRRDAPPPEPQVVAEA